MEIWSQMGKEKGWQAGITGRRKWEDLLPGEETGAVPSITERRTWNETPYARTVYVGADFGDHAKEYYVYDAGERAGVVVDREGDILLTRQYRLLIDSLSWEIPGGAVDNGETPAEAARRECAEETGVQCGAIQRLAEYHVGLDTSYNPTYIYHCAVDPATVEQTPHDCREVAQALWVPLATCLEMIDRREIVDSLTMLALLAYARLVLQCKPESREDQ
jgi:8-oxo-dGTP pyrophosphatase MutT (NUDIX family)